MRTAWTIGSEDTGLELTTYLRMKRGFSRRLFKAIKADGGQIFVNGAAGFPGRVLEVGDCIEFLLPDEAKGPLMIAEEIPLSILYEDEAVIVVDKPAGMAVIPSRNHPNGTLANALLAHYEDQGLNSTVHIATRLDRDTSGLVLIAKNRYAHALISSSQKAGLVDRSYTAIVEGRFMDGTGKIDLPIGRKQGSIIERIVMEDGQHAVTRYEVKQTGDSLSCLSVQLETGRTHQIRVHLSHIGHPLAGDTLYGGRTDQIKRQALHCGCLSIVHPYEGKRLDFQAGLPEDMLRLIPGMN